MIKYILYNTKTMDIRYIIYIRCFLVLMILAALSGAVVAQEQQVRIVWDKAPVSGSVSLINEIGCLDKIIISGEVGKIDGSEFRFLNQGANELIVKFCAVERGPSDPSPLVRVSTEEYGFSFFLENVTHQYPIYIPHFSVIIVPEDDNRTYREIEKEIKTRGLSLKLDEIMHLPEASYSEAQENGILQFSPTWLGFGRDIRMFEIEENLRYQPKQKTTIYPQYISQKRHLNVMNNLPAVYSYTLGRGQGVKSVAQRRLYKGYFPVLETRWKDDDIGYKILSYCSLPISKEGEVKNLEGMDYTISDAFSNGYQRSPGYSKEKEEAAHSRLDEHESLLGSMVLCIQGEAFNEGDVPRYVWYKTLYPGYNWSSSKAYKYTFEAETGFSYYDTTHVFAVSKLNGEPASFEEHAILLNPGEKVKFEFYLPHEPIEWDQAIELAKWDMDELFKQTVTYWEKKLDSAAEIRVPEKRIDEMLKAGLLHLELMTFGSEPQGALAANAGRFLPIGTESAPIIQYFCSIGKSDIAKRCLDYFMEKQRDDGALRNYQGYSVETGAVLWTVGEYMRYTEDVEWLKENKDRLLKACEYLISWRHSDEGTGSYQLISGNVADPDDNFRQFMLNGYAYLGLSRMGEVLEEIDVVRAKRIQSEAELWKKDIRYAFRESLARSPVVPLGDGRWSPTAPPWAEAIGGPRALYAEKGSVFSHGTFMALDALLGPLYLVFCEVFDIDEWYTDMLLEYHSELFFQGNTAFSQPYYSRHNWIQLKKDMVKPFLNTYYNTMAGMADPETYTFSEHTYENSIYKVHEEAWFLMQTRWMLYMEEGNTLSLLKAIPREWMENGKVIKLDNVQSYFGPISLNVHSYLAEGYIEASIKCGDTNRKPVNVRLRLPHPQYKKPKKVIGGKYDEKTETVVIPYFSGERAIRVEF